MQQNDDISLSNKAKHATDYMLNTATDARL